MRQVPPQSLVDPGARNLPVIRGGSNSWQFPPRNLPFANPCPGPMCWLARAMAAPMRPRAATRSRSLTSLLPFFLPLLAIAAIRPPTIAVPTTPATMPSFLASLRLRSSCRCHSRRSRSHSARSPAMQSAASIRGDQIAAARREQAGHCGELACSKNSVGRSWNPELAGANAGRSSVSVIRKEWPRFRRLFPDRIGRNVQHFAPSWDRRNPSRSASACKPGNW